MNLRCKSFFIFSFLFLLGTGGRAQEIVHSSSASFDVSSATVPLWGDAPFHRPTCVRGIHLTAWATGSKRFRKKFEKIFSDTEINTAVIAVKEISGEVYIPGVKWDETIFVSTQPKPLHPFKRAIPDVASYLTHLKERGIFVIARITVFQDQTLPKLKPEWAVHSSSPLPKAVDKGFKPHVWVDYRGLAWTDPYNPDVQEYNLAVAERAAQLGFQGVQFDYIRFPSDGLTRFCRYSQPHSSKTGPVILSQFLKKAKERLAPYNVELSIDTFGLAGSLKNDLGIGQKLSTVVEHIDVLSPMMYPSHYNKGLYGIDDPNSSPYETVFRSVRDTRRTLEGTGVQLRPYFQDFSLGVKYTPEMVRDQIEAAMDQGIYEWLMWNPRSRYTKKAFQPN